MVDPSGEFNRHANGMSEYAFIEAGSVLVHALSFLYSKTGDATWLATADSIIAYSFSHRDPTTDLVPNCPSKDRWDKYASTTEIGLWAQYILKSIPFVPVERGAKWLDIVQQALAPWLDHGFDDQQQMFYGALALVDATPIRKDDTIPTNQTRTPTSGIHYFPDTIIPCNLRNAVLCCMNGQVKTFTGPLQKNG